MTNHYVLQGTPNAYHAYGTPKASRWSPELNVRAEIRSSAPTLEEWSAHIVMQGIHIQSLPHHQKRNSGN